MNRFPKHHIETRRVLAALFAFALLFSSSNAFSQYDETDENVYNLSPFEVSSEGDTGYAAQNTLAGSRLNTSLKDTAAAISVYTLEFLDDIGATSVADALNYSVSAEVDYVDTTPSTNGGNQILENSYSFRIRGLLASRSRNYFKWTLKTDSYNVERLDESRGPNSILFGIGSAGGVVNSSTKKAHTYGNFGNVSVTVGDYSTRRGTLDYNHVLVEDVLAVRLNFLREDLEGYRHHMESEQTSYHLALTYKPFEKTTIYLEYEDSEGSDNRARPGTTYDEVSLWIDSGSPVIDTSPDSGFDRDGSIGTNFVSTRDYVTFIDNIGEVENFRRFLKSRTDSRSGEVLTDPRFFSRDMNLTGPFARRDMPFETYSLILQHAATEKLHFELAYNHLEDTLTNYDPRNGALDVFGDPNSHLPSGVANPLAGQYYTETNWIRRSKSNDTDQFRASASYELETEDFGRHRFAALYQREDNHFLRTSQREVLAGAPNHSTPENARNRVYRRHYFTPGDFRTMFASDYLTPASWTDPDTGDSHEFVFIPHQASGQADDDKTLESYQFSMQNFLFNERVVTTFGYREDDFTSIDSITVRDPVTNIWTVDKEHPTTYKSDGGTSTIGIVGHLTDNLSLFYNNSTSTALGDPNMLVLPDNLIPELTDDKGIDLGVMVELFEGKINARMSYYETENTGGADFRSTQNFSDTNNDIWEAMADAGKIPAGELDSHLTGFTAGYFDRNADGLELQVVANPTENWRFVVNASETNVVESNIYRFVEPWLHEQVAAWRALGDTDTIMVEDLTVDEEITRLLDRLERSTVFNGKTAYGNRQYKFNTFTKYTFDEGSLAGFSIGGGYRHQDHNPITIMETGEIVYGQSINLVDLVFGYRTKLFDDKVGMSLQLNISNAFDNDDVLFMRAETSGKIVRNAVQAPRMAKLTARFDF